MPLTQPLAELRKNIREILIEDLPAAIKALGELLPEGSEKHSIALSMLAQIKEANKAHFKNTISPEEYARRIDTVRANFLDLLNGLEEADFEEPLEVGKGNASAAKTGSVLYRVPHRMPLRKPVICTVRVAIDEDALLEDIVLDANVRIKQRVEVSDMMKAELLDPDGSVFQIRSLSEVTQLVRETGKTQWLFSVTPLLEGEHQLLVKVSMMEFVPNLGTYVPREVSILETVTIVTELAITDEEEVPMKSAGESFAMSQPLPGGSEGESGGEDAMEVESAKGAWEPLSPPPPAPIAPPSEPYVITDERNIASEPATESYIPAPQPMIQPRQSRPISGKVRALSFLLLFLIVGSTATYALTPPPVRDFWFAELSGSAEAFAEYIEEYKNDPEAQPRVEKAYFRKALKTEALDDLRAYQQTYPSGQYREKIAEKVKTLELREVESIRRQPTGERIRNFLKNYPESNQLTAVAEAAATDEQILREVQTELDATLEQKAETATTTEEVQALMPALRAAASAASVERVEKIVARKTEIRQEVRPQLQEIKTAVQEREKKRTGDVGQKTTQSSLTERLSDKANDKKEALSEKIEARKTDDANQQTDNTPLKNHLDDKKETITNKIEARKDQLTATDTKNTEPDNIVEPTPSPSGRAGEGLSAIADGMVLVSGGTFTMGCLDGRDKDCEKDEKPSHSVALDDFYISRTEVTQAQWQAIMGINPSEFKDCPSCPVENVSWDDAQEFLKKLNALSSRAKYRLPTEAEWEYAARGGGKSKGYLYSGSNQIDEVAWHDGNSGRKTHPIGTKKKNELGLFDMSGNVLEWCSDRYGGYASAAQNNPTGSKNGSSRVLRGGSWYSSPQVCRVASRGNGVAPGVRSNGVGFRLARTK
ncbi:MAG: SUMF1/EgtB/PvdO family nonheme iron enzyme [Saprospiraceae bacterium]